ncbi:hypothetical protein CC85DRAFT_284619 [Cutaneotrichosporon oleaginosum]|uniref:Uncharacterized protein n=1 Tax=Cutaneotrichosporon oleaginosum TaxID=879819 RepID=A0A0J0XQB6_9TREE|nr:uncharacterized protein CC85DRAFT_284619 [Cutaneotrichosporon oleaginosum]KLT43272.1 hypothetical protein CC85DRAFT_284619 [Cutaneotrichosporon oleaginosum]TXT14465.1 hypothetical protein COLE_00658 [Cutaneotrichosporon oleaginosum]
MQRKGISALEAARKELHRKSPQDLTINHLTVATDVALGGGDDAEVLGFAASLLRQLAATLDLPGVHQLIETRIEPALRPRGALAELIVTNLAHKIKSRAQRSSEALTAAVRLTPTFPNLLVPLFTAIVSDSLGRRSNLLGITILANAVPDSAIPVDLLPRLMVDVDEKDAAAQRCGAIVALLSRRQEDGWLDSLLPYLGKKESAATLSRYLLPALTKVHRSAYEPLLSLLDEAASDDRYFGPWVSAASYGVSAGFITLEGLPQQRLMEGISHSDLTVRIMAFELLAHSRSIFDYEVMILVKKALEINTIVPTANGRTEMRSAIHSFLNTTKAQEEQAVRNLKKKGEVAERARAILNGAEDFHKWWLDAYLGPSIKACREMPHLRSIFALLLLRLYTEIYGPSVYERVFTAERVADLIACQASEFVDARLGARNLIALAPLPLAGYESLDTPPAQRLLVGARSSINHPRLTQADAGRAALCILFTKLVVPLGHKAALSFVADTMEELERHLQKAEDNVARGIVEYPLHGPLSVLVDLVRCLDLSTSEAQAAWSSTFHALNAIVHRVWGVTRKVLSLGPEDEGTSHEIARAFDVLEEEDEEGDHTNLLSGSWRAAREAAELLSAIITVPLHEGQTVWNEAEVDAAGRTFLLWLHEIRHRGTFSSIAPAFGTVVEAVQRIPSLSHLVRVWVDSLLDTVAEGKLSTLRRSAALPYTFLALLSDRTQRDRAINTLLSMASLSSSTSDPTKVHSMNILKVVLLDAKQAHLLPLYLERTLITSLQAFGSANWAVRNVALILFSTLTNRALSTSRPQDDSGRAALDARQTLASWHQKYPNLLPYIIQTLRNVRGRGPLSLGEHSPLFPLLIIIRSLRWSVDGEALAASLYPAVEPFLSSREWMVRAAAAQALSSLLSPEAGLDKAKVTATRISHASDEPNLLHGRLLFLRRLLEDVVDRADGVAPRLRDALGERAHPMISAAILDCVVAYGRVCPTGKGSDESDGLLPAAAAAARGFLTARPTVGSDLLHTAAARVLILAGETVSLLKPSVPEDAQLLALEAMEHTPATLAAVIHLARRGSNAVRTAALEALADWPDCGADILTLREEMLRLAAHARSVPLKEAALSAVGRAFASTPANAEWSTLAELVADAADESQSEPRRESALSALTSLAPIIFTLPTPVRGRLLRSLLALLEDDDLEIRSGAAAVMSAARGQKPVDQHSAVDAWWEWVGAHVGEEREEWEGWLWSLVLPPQQTSAEARLFVEEPPNLFRNAVAVAERAANVLATLGGDSAGRRQALAVVDRIEDGAAYAPIDAGWAAAHIRRRRAAAVRTALGL